MQGGNTEVTDNKYDENRSVQLKLSELDLLRESIEMKIERQRRIWSKNITRFLYSNYKSESSMAKDINQNPETIFRWMQGELPIGRSVILQTGIANCEDLRELNNFIGKSGRSFYLNPLDCEDSIIMYIMKDETIDKNNASYESICERIKYLLSGKSNFFGKHENALLDFVSGRGMLFDNAMEILYDYIRFPLADLIARLNNASTISPLSKYSIIIKSFVSLSLKYVKRFALASSLFFPKITVFLSLYFL